MKFSPKNGARPMGFQKCVTRVDTEKKINHVLESVM